VLPRVTHPTCCFKDVSRAHIGAILPVLLSARNAPCEPSDNIRPPRSDRDWWVASGRDQVIGRSLCYRLAPAATRPPAGTKLKPMTVNP